MIVIVKARHMNLTPSLKEHAEQKLGNALMRIIDKPSMRIDIELNAIGHVRDGKNKECRVTVVMPRGKTINLVEVDEDMYKAIDLAHDRLLEQVKRERDRRLNTSNRRKQAKKARAETARKNMTTARETWEDEVQQYETAMAHS
ncbi:MAG: ribosome-associated translation inhibitor RaiA [Deltaproteobacteria bacterium]|nr:ribosome-associated translation inhibitor RaiA [Deltaproteobacteria bacterium]